MCTRVFTLSTRIRAMTCFRMLLIMKLGLKINNCQDQNEELGVQTYLQLAEFDFIRQIFHNDQTKVEVKTCFLWLKFKMVSFCFDFELFIEILFLKVGFSYSLKSISTNTIFLFALKQVFHHYKVFFSHIRCFCYFQCIFCIYTQSTLTLEINIFPRTMVL